jgi:hypothetical protein
MDPMALYQSIEANKRRDQEKLSSSMEGVNKAVMMMAQQAMRAELAGERGEAARIKAKAILDAKKLELEASAEEGRLGREEKQLGRDEDIVKRLEVMMVEDPESYKLYQSKFSPEGAFKGLRGPMGGNRFPAPTPTQAAGVPIHTDEEVDNVTLAREARKNRGDIAAKAAVHTAARDAKLAVFAQGGEQLAVKGMIPLLRKYAKKYHTPYTVGKKGKKIKKTEKMLDKQRKYGRSSRITALKKATRVASQYKDIQERFPNDPALKTSYWDEKHEKFSPLAEHLVELYKESWKLASTEIEEGLTGKREDDDLKLGRDKSLARTKSSLRTNEDKEKDKRKAIKDAKDVPITRRDEYQNHARNATALSTAYANARRNKDDLGSLQGYIQQMAALEGAVQTSMDNTEISDQEMLRWQSIKDFVTNMKDRAILHTPPD